MIERIISLYEAGLSTRQIEKFVPVKRTRIISILQENGIQLRSKGNPYQIRWFETNTRYFEKIDTSDKAYWLGFIIADGYVGDDGITINLAKKDRNHLSKFLDAIGSNTAIKETSQGVKVCVYSKEMAQDLRNLGLFRDKSKTATYPRVLDSLNRDIIRGVVDGDGSIAITKNTYKQGKNPTYTLSVCGTKDVVEAIANKVCGQLNLATRKLENRGNEFYVTSWGGNKQVLKILDWLYEGADTFLDRKYERYLKLKNL